MESQTMCYRNRGILPDPVQLVAEYLGLPIEAVFLRVALLIRQEIKDALDDAEIMSEIMLDQYCRFRTVNLRTHQYCYEVLLKGEI